MASFRFAVIFVDLTKKPYCSRRAGAAESTYQVVTSTTILAWIWLAVVDVDFAILSVKTFLADTFVGADQVTTNATIHARGGFALVDLFLAVRTSVSFVTVTFVRVPKVLTCSIVAQLFEFYFFPDRSILARHHFHIAHFACPAHGTLASELVLLLTARRSVLTGVLGAPVDKGLALFSLISVGTMALIVSVLVNAGSTVLAWR